MKRKLIEKLESELLLSLFNYVVPFIGKKINKAQEAKQYGSLEGIVNNQKPKISFGDIKELESLLFKNLSGNARAGKSIGVNSGSISYSLTLRRQKNSNEKSGKYSISIKYGENEKSDKLRISVKKDQKGVYSAEIWNKKDAEDKVAPYKVTIAYEDNYAEERLTISYRQQLRSYMQQHIADKEDTTNRVPLKWLNILPETMMGGVLGFTYLGENFMGRRAGLTGKTARMVDIHESIHTPDEYETRILTGWIMEKVKSKYVK